MISASHTSPITTYAQRQILVHLLFPYNAIAPALLPFPFLFSVITELK